MVGDRYFQKFPNIYYNGTLCKDLARRVTINANEDIQGTLDIFYPYTITHHLRPDHVAEYYYKDPEQDWLVYLANKIIDPYYGWYLDQFNFNSMIVNKYGSIENAQRRIRFYRNNWATDDQELSKEFHDNTLSMDLRKYYEPNWGPSKRIISYKRRKDDTTYSTNRINRYTIGTVTGTFEDGEPITFHNSPQEAVVGKGEVMQVADGYLYAQHLEDSFTNEDGTKEIRGTISGASTLVSDVRLMIQNISDDDQEFFDRVSWYDWEVEENEKKKEIFLVGAGPHTMISQQIKNTLMQNTNRITGFTTE